MSSFRQQLIKKQNDNEQKYTFPYYYWHINFMGSKNAKTIYSDSLVSPLSFDYIQGYSQDS